MTDSTKYPVAVAVAGWFNDERADDSDDCHFNGQVTVTIAQMERLIAEAKAADASAPTFSIYCNLWLNAPKTGASGGDCPVLSGRGGTRVVKKARAAVKGTAELLTAIFKR